VTSEGGATAVDSRAFQQLLRDIKALQDDLAKVHHCFCFCSSAVFDKLRYLSAASVFCISLNQSINQNHLYSASNQQTNLRRYEVVFTCDVAKHLLSLSFFLFSVLHYVPQH